jgi:hypothetical protein
MAAKSMSMAATKKGAGMEQIGDGAYTWKVSPTHVDLSMPPATPVLATIIAEPPISARNARRSSRCSGCFRRFARAGFRSFG